MLKSTALLILCLILLPGISAQEPAARSTHEMPQWLVDFSNLPREDRARYLDSFNKAKAAFQQGQWVICYSHLVDCEMFFKGNPNVWNLRACCLMEQKFFDEAAAELEKARRALPDNPVTVLNLSNLYLATGRYAESVAITDDLLARLPEDTPAELRDILTYRKVLALVLQGRVHDARLQVAHLSSMSDTPLYYYSQAAFHLAAGNKVEAARCLRIVGNIFAKGNSTVAYHRALELSRLTEQNPPAPR